MTTQVALRTQRGASLKNNTRNISNCKYCHIEASQKAEITNQFHEKLEGTTNASEETPPPCGLFECYMPPKSSIWLWRKTWKSQMCKYRWVACHIYIMRALPSFPKEPVSPSALSSGLLMDFSWCGRMSATDFIFYVCASLHFIEAYRKWTVGFSGVSHITRKAMDLQLGRVKDTMSILHLPIPEFHW